MNTEIPDRDDRSEVNDAKKVCTECGRDRTLEGNRSLKRGWTNALYCSQACETSGVNGVHRSMPGIGPSPDGNWIPSHTKREIKSRWEEEEAL